MNSDYLWDRTGEPDPLVASLESSLGELRFEPVFVIESGAPAAEHIVQRGPSRTTLLVAAAAGLAAAALAFGLGYVVGTTDEPAPMVAVVAQPSIGPAPSIVEPAVVAGPSPVLGAQIEAPDTPKTPTTSPPSSGKIRSIAPAPNFDAPPVAKKKSPPRKPGQGRGSVARSTPRAKPSENPSVDCILDPSKCKRTPTVGDPKPASSGMADGRKRSLSSTDIKDGIQPFKAEAKRCGPKYNVPPGTKVKVKASVSGETGRITRAKAIGEHAGTDVGKCVADALSQATFPRFAKPAVGFLYPVKL